MTQEREVLNPNPVPQQAGQLDRIEQLLRELHRDFRALKAEVASLERKLGVD